MCMAAPAPTMVETPAPTPGARPNKTHSHRCHVVDQGNFLLYKAPNGAVNVGVFFQGETVWLTQKTLAELFGVGVPAIAKHLKNIFESGELDRAATVSKMEMVRQEGGREVIRQVEFYNLGSSLFQVGSPARARTTRGRPPREWRASIPGCASSWRLPSRARQTSSPVPSVPSASPWRPGWIPVPPPRPGSPSAGLPRAGAGRE